MKGMGEGSGGPTGERWKGGVGLGQGCQAEWGRAGVREPGSPVAEVVCGHRAASFLPYP